jgi:hypothetical protein
VSTENGMELLPHARRDIEVLRDRLDYLDGWLEAHEAATGHPDTGVRMQEARAIRWALPILEAEWDAMARIKRETVLRAMHPGDAKDRGLLNELAVSAP